MSSPMLPKVVFLKDMVDFYGFNLVYNNVTLYVSSSTLYKFIVKVRTDDKSSSFADVVIGRCEPRPLV